MSEAAHRALHAHMYGHLCDSTIPNLLQVRELYDHACRMELAHAGAEIAVKTEMELRYKQLAELTAARQEIEQLRSQLSMVQEAAKNRNTDPPPTDPDVVHLGDGAYVDLKGREGINEIIIMANSHQRSMATDVVYLEADAIAALVRCLATQFPDHVRLSLPTKFIGDIASMLLSD